MVSTKQELDLVGQDLWSVASGVVVHKLGWLYNNDTCNKPIVALYGMLSLHDQLCIQRNLSCKVYRYGYSRQALTTLEVNKYM